MDPTVTLRELREHVRLVNDTTTSRAARATHAEWAIEKFEALDEWISRGGFPPAQWGNLVTKSEPVKHGTSDGVTPPAQRINRRRDDATQPRVLPDPIDDIQRELEPDPWGTHASLSALNGAISAGEAVNRKLRGDA